MARMQGANKYARRAFLNNIHQTVDTIVADYSAASPSDRKALLKEIRKGFKVMWTSNDWPSALGLAITSLNAQSRFVPGADAAYVRSETDRLIKEAAQAATEPWPTR